MYIHIGNSVIISLQSIVSILCLKKQNSRINKEFIRMCDSEGRLEKIFKTEPKCCVITENKIYLSSLSSSTLVKRIREKNREKAWK